MKLDDLLPILIVVGSIAVSIYRAVNERGKKKSPPQNQQQSPQTKQAVQPTQAGQPSQGDLQRRLEEARRRVQQAMEGQQTGKGGNTPPPLISGGLEGQTARRGTLESSGGLLQNEDYELKPLVLERERLQGQDLTPQELKPERLEDTLSKGERNVFRPIDASNRNPSDFQQQVSTVKPFMSEPTHRGRTQLTEATIQPRKRQRIPTGEPKHAKISGSELLSPEMLTEKELLRGFLWQQILSEPRSKEKLRTYSMQKAKAKG
jgi:hypothetical protein